MFAIAWVDAKHEPMNTVAAAKARTTLYLLFISYLSYWYPRARIVSYVTSRLCIY